MAFVLGLATLAYASGDAEHAEHGLNWKDFLFRVVNFVLVFGVIAKLAGKKIVGFFRGRVTQIENQMADLDGRKAEAAKRLADIEASHQQPRRREKNASRTKYAQQGEKMRDAIIAAAEAKAVQIREQAVSAAAAETRAAVEKIRSEIADAVVESARPCCRRS